MLKKKTFAIVGGDQRQAHLANLLAGKAMEDEIYAMFFDDEVKFSARIHRSEDIRLVLPQSDIIIFPLPILDAEGKLNTPLSSQHISFAACLEYILSDSTIFGGMVSDEIHTMAYSHHLEIIDYLQREEFSVLNAIPTAEGAVEIALREMPSTLFGSTCLVTGFGRIAKALVKLLCAFGANVRVVARKHSDLAWASVYGCEALALNTLGDHLKDVDVVFNTVPAVILDEEKLSRLDRECLVIDLASKPGGVDMETAQQLGLKTIWALSLPGKVAPLTAGEITLQTIFNILEERGKLL